MCHNSCIQYHSVQKKCVPVFGFMFYLNFLVFPFSQSNCYVLSLKRTFWHKLYFVSDFGSFLTQNQKVILSSFCVMCVWNTWKWQRLLEFILIGFLLTLHRKLLLGGVTVGGSTYNRTLLLIGAHQINYPYTESFTLCVWVVSINTFERELVRFGLAVEVLQKCELK